MPNTIRDGQGTGYLVGVNSEHRLQTSSVQRSKEHHANVTHGKAFNIYIEVTPTGAGDCFFYVKNTGTKNLVFEGFSLYAASNEKVTGYFGQTGTPAGGTDVTPANLNSGSAETYTGTAQYGADITGLSGGYKIASYRIPANNASNVFNFEADLVLAPNKTFSVYASTGGILLEGYIMGWIEEESA